MIDERYFLKNKRATTFLLSVIILVAILAAIMISCDKDDSNPTSSSPKEEKVTCTAGCNSMNWGIKDETGPKTTEQSCSRSYQGNSYVETCTGTVKYSNSGKTYNFKAVYDWPNCKISVTVTGVGSCTDQVGSSLPKTCHCEEMKPQDMIIKEFDVELCK